MSSFPHNGLEFRNNQKRAQTGNLNRFKEAKTSMQKILNDLIAYVAECDLFIQDILSSDERFHSLLPVKLPDKITSYHDKLKGILEIVDRNQMKCAFFGRTSNGKSTVINAMLGDRILPAGIGHTTCCFLQIEGCNQDQGFILFDNETKPQPIDSVRSLGNSLSARKLASDSRIHIYWPNSRCILLKDEVVFLDSPGIDIDPDMDAWIDKHCLDADVFILVANAESTLMQAEKNFFHKVSQKLSKPNIFILNNRWDASASEMEFVDEVRQQHTDRCKEFLVKELKVCGKEEAEERVFFVSAKEVLIKRSRRGGGDSPLNDTQLSFAFSDMAEGWQSRFMEFTNFEKVFQNTLSDSAIKTKFSSHADQGRNITNDLKDHLEQLYDNALEEKDAAVNVSRISQLRYESIRRDMELSSQTVDAALAQCLAVVEQEVAQVLHDEIRQLGELINRFDRPFHSDLQLLKVYKLELNKYVEKTLGTRLEEACTSRLSKEVVRLESTMIDTYRKLDIDNACRSRMPTLINKSTFRPVFHIDCRNICSDFHENIDFLFSLGFTNIMRRMIPAKSNNYNSTANSILSENSSSSILTFMTSTFPSLISRNSVGAVVVLGVLVRATGWRVLALCGVLYGGMYVYERFAWTNKAKERVFKRQYTDYASNKLRLIVHLTSTNVGHQVRQEITRSKEKLQREVEQFNQSVKTECDQLTLDIAKLEKISNETKKLKNATKYWDECLGTFQETFISTN